MNFDLRFPLGLMFTLFGLMLSVYGFLTKTDPHQKSLGININLIWGLCILVFGAVTLARALRKVRK